MLQNITDILLVLTFIFSTIAFLIYPFAVFIFGYDKEDKKYWQEYREFLDSMSDDELIKHLRKKESEEEKRKSSKREIESSIRITTRALHTVITGIIVGLIAFYLNEIINIDSNLAIYIKGYGFFVLLILVPVFSLLAVAIALMNEYALYQYKKKYIDNIQETATRHCETA